ncbi:MAG: DNA repair protein RecO [Oscillospiraceae bacterium]|nr:DNA repair protein RecO [Oscillospiraceae bacterium]
MLVKTSGVIVKVKKFGNDSRLLWILTNDRGLIRVFDKERTNGGGFVATELFCCSDFVLFRGKEAFRVNLAEIKEAFWGLRSDIVSFVLASYFCEVVCKVFCEATSPDNFEAFSELIICSFHLLALKKKNFLLVKAAFELKIACLLGFLPDISGDGKFFSSQHGCLVNSRDDECFLISGDILAAMSFIIRSSGKKMFSFELSEENLNKLGNLTEKYLIDRLECEIKTLVHFKQFWNLEQQPAQTPKS